MHRETGLFDLKVNQPAKYFVKMALLILSLLELSDVANVKQFTFIFSIYFLIFYSSERTGGVISSFCQQ